MLFYGIRLCKRTRLAICENIIMRLIDETFKTLNVTERFAPFILQRKWLLSGIKGQLYTSTFVMRFVALHRDTSGYNFNFHGMLDFQKPVQKWIRT